MNTLRMQPAAARTLAVLVAACAALWLPARATAAHERESRGNLAQALKKTLLVFPFDMPGAGAPNSGDVQGLLNDIAQARLTAAGRYVVTPFYRTLGPVARLHNEQQLTDADVAPPFAEDTRKALKIARLVGYETVFVGSFDDYQYDESAHKASVTLSGRLVDVESGKVAKSVTLSGTSASGGTAKEDERALDAARQTAEKLMTQLAPGGPAVIEPVAPTPASEPARKRRNNDWIWGLLAIGLGLGIGLSSGGGGGGGGGGSDNPPPPPS